MALAIGIMKVNQPITIIVYTIVTNFLCQAGIACYKKNEE
jgi:hypothetical protein